MLFYNFTTLDNLIEDNLIANLEEEKKKLNHILALFEDKKENLLKITTNMISVTNTVEKEKLNEFYDTVALLKASFQEMDQISNFASKLITMLDTILVLFQENLEENRNQIKADLIEYNKQSDELSNNIFHFEKNITSVLNSAIELSLISSQNTDTTNLLNNTFTEDKNIITDHKTLVISEREQKAYLPYLASDIEKIYKNANGKYTNKQELINDLYILPLSRFKSSSISRFREAFRLMREKENSSMVKALELGLELMFHYALNPIVIAACKNIDELDIYLDCLESKELYDFKCFEIEFDVAPQITKNDSDYKI